MRVIPYLLGPAIRRFSSALLFDPPLEVEVPAWPHPESPVAFTAVVDAAKKADSELAPMMAVAEKYLWLQQTHAQSLKETADALGSHVRLITTLFPATPTVFKAVRRVYLANTTLAVGLTNAAPAAACAAFEFHRRVFGYWTEMGASPSEVVAALESEASPLGHPMELVIESYVNRFLNTFGVAASTSAESEGGTRLIHPLVDSVEAAELGGACIVERNFDRPGTLGQVAEGKIAREVNRAPVAFLLFDRLVANSVPNINDPDAARQLVALLDDHGDALAALRKKCLNVAGEVTTKADSRAVFEERLASALETLSDEAAAVRGENRTTTKKYVAALKEDSVLWGLAAALAGLAVGVMPGVGTLPAIVGLFIRLGTSAQKARRERGERLSKSDLRLLYYVDAEHRIG